tara:strand:- start:123160 stop:123969 length:810 start_codon:yes stop_codon:yes gene_type:complete
MTIDNLSAIVVDATPDLGAEQRIRMAMQIARERGASLTAVCSAWPKSASLAEVLAPSSLHMMTEEQKLREALSAMRSTFDRLAQDAPERMNWCDGIADPRVTLSKEGVLADLIVMGVAGASKLAQADPVDVALTTGAAVLRLSTKPPQILRRALIGWKDGREAGCALRAALPFLRHAEAITVLGVGETVTADCLEAVQRYLAARGLDAPRQHLPASGRSEASVIAEYAENEGVDFLVAGGRAQGRWKERVFGGVTQDLLKTDITWVLAN